MPIRESNTKNAAVPQITVIAVEPIALALEEAARIFLPGVPTWTLRFAIMSGALKARRCGRTHTVEPAELRRWYATLDEVKPSTAPSILTRNARPPVIGRSRR
jgi:hypothetical protein